MTTEYSTSQLISFAERGMLDKVELADLLPEEPRAAFLAACAEVERAFTRACAAHDIVPRVRRATTNVFMRALMPDR